MKIGDLAAKTGVEVDTIRFYEREGLIPKVERQANGYRAYGQVHLERLAFIRHCRALDMPLAEVRQLLEFVEHPKRDCTDVNVLIDEQLLRVKARLKSMRALERQLTSLRAQCHSHHSTRQCGILKDLVAAAHGEACACHQDAH